MMSFAMVVFTRFFGGAEHLMYGFIFMELYDILL